MDFLRKQIESSSRKLSTPSDSLILDTKKRYIIAHFDGKKSENYQRFTKLESLVNLFFL